MNFIEKLNNTDVTTGSVHIYWIGQAGFIIKTAGGKIIMIDPYLTDSVYEGTKSDLGYAFKRVSPALFEPDEIEADYCFCSHEHGDHVDTEAIARIKAPIYTNSAGADVAKQTGTSEKNINVISRGDKLEFEEFTLIVIAAQHGDLSPGALGFIFDFDFTSIYYAGDTAYDIDALKPAIDAKPMIALLPINGEYGNLNSKEAAMLSSDLKSKICIPHHYWTFPRHMGNPNEFLEMMQKYSPLCKPIILTPGEAFPVH